MSNSSNVTFGMTESQRHFALLFEQYASIPGACVCFLVLVVCGVAVFFPRPRHCLDRISFRLVIYALTSRVCFAIAYAATPGSPGPRCDFSAFMTNVFVCYSAFVTTCIAINLQLVVVHQINGHRMEKYYLILPMLLSIAFSVPPYALHQFGWDEASSVCWYRNPHPNARFHWIIATQSIPLSLAVSTETVCSGILLVYMYLVRRSTRPFFMLTSIRSTSWRAPESNPSPIEIQTLSTNIAQHPRYRKAILRIVLYPIVSLLVNSITIALDLSRTIRGVNTKEDYHVLILVLCLFGIRTLPYGLLALFDPAFTNAVGELRGKNKSTAPINTGFISDHLRSRSYSSPRTITTNGSETQLPADMEVELEFTGSQL